MNNHSRTVDILPHGIECNIPLDNGIFKSFTAKNLIWVTHVRTLYQINIKVYIHSNCDTLFVFILFIIPVIVEVHTERYEIYTMVLVIYDNVDIAFGMKNFVKLEADIDTRELKFNFINISMPIFSTSQMGRKKKGN